MMDRITDFWVFNVNSLVLTALVAVVFVVFHELATVAVARLKRWLKKVDGVDEKVDEVL